jgi:transcriptional regulator with XRE-family HTH domain
MGAHPLWDSPRAKAAAAAGRRGEIVRFARRAAGWRQADLGARTGYSAATISRFETGRRPLADLDTLLRFCRVLAIPPAVFGLTAPGRNDSPAPASAPAGACGTKVVTGQARNGEGGDDPVKRRELLAGVASVAAARMIAVRAATGAAPAGAADPRARNLLDLLMVPGPALPSSVTSLERSAAAARASFNACRYHLLSQRLPGLISQLAASVPAAATSGQRADLLRLTCDAYCLASELCVKLGEDAIAWVTADRALEAARRSRDPLAMAIASRRVSIAMRRQGHHRAAVSVLTSTATGLDTGTGNRPRELAAYASLLSTAAYTAAKSSHQHQALELIAEAGEAAARLPAGTPGFDAAYLTQYQVGVHTCLGDPASALRHASQLTPRALPTPQRRARFCIDTARAWMAYGNPGKTLEALLAAEHFAPEEACRPSVRAIAADLLSTRTPQPAELRAFATRCGAAP